MSDAGGREHLIHDRRKLYVVLGVTIVYFATELGVGWWINSLALLSDAVHMLTDIAALVLSLVTLWISMRPATTGKTYGYLRAEILGALLNGLFLWLLVVFIWIEALQRLRTPQATRGLPMIAVACIGLLVNGFSARMTYEERTEPGRAGMAIRAAFVHVISDMIGVAGVLLAGAVVYFTGWARADPTVSIFIGALVLYGSWGLVRDGIDILMESVPAAIDLDQVRNQLLSVEGAEELHDLHVWCLTSREIALSAHAVVTPSADQDRVLSDMHAVLEEKFRIKHVTLQLERDSRRELEHKHY
ncbi:MAG TPA: cation diffusion facilitator family transporter [Candidatus Binataceae bacterium]|nr:cation diffusion facilitator family transporter [Candidatus Binataceae bacterium]